MTDVHLVYYQTLILTWNNVVSRRRENCIQFVPQFMCDCPSQSLHRMTSLTKVRPNWCWFLIFRPRFSGTGAPKIDCFYQRCVFWGCNRSALQCERSIWRRRCLGSVIGAARSHRWMGRNAATPSTWCFLLPSSLLCSISTPQNYPLGKFSFLQFQFLYCKYCFIFNSNCTWASFFFLFLFITSS